MKMFSTWLVIMLAIVIGCFCLSNITAVHAEGSLYHMVQLTVEQLVRGR